MGRPFTIHDDRGRRHSMPDPAGSPADQADSPALRVHRLFRLKLEVARSPLRRWTFTLLCIGLGIGAVVIPDGHSRAPAQAAGVVLIRFGLSLPIVTPRRRNRIEANIATLPPMCAVCGCDMRGVYPGREGIAECPRCGAGWRFGTGSPAPTHPPIP